MGIKPPAVIALVIPPFDTVARSTAFELFGKQLKDEIHRLVSGQWETVVRLGPDARIVLWNHTRADAVAAIDGLMQALSDPDKATEIYRLLHANRQRLERQGLTTAGILIRPDGSTESLDTKGSA